MITLQWQRKEKAFSYNCNPAWFDMLFFVIHYCLDLLGIVMELGACDMKIVTNLFGEYRFSSMSTTYVMRYSNGKMPP